LAPAGIDNDRDAIAAWLAVAGRSPHTRRAYHREAERLVLWTVVERRKALSSLDADDCGAYRAFLADPQPRVRWCVRPSPGRQSSLWRPFTGPLGAAGQRQAIAALSSLFGFLVERRYLWANPWRERPSGSPDSWPPVQHTGQTAPDALHGPYHPKALATAHRPPAPARPRRGSPARPLDASRSLSPALWAGVLAAADALPPVGAHQRLRFALRWLYATGLRLSEAVGARLADLRHEPASDGTPAAWWLSVRPAGAARTRELPLPDSLIDALRDYLGSRGLDPDPLLPGQRETFVLGQATERSERASRLPMSGPIDARQGLRAATLARQLKQHFGVCAAARAEVGDADGARQLAAASAHWLRHTHARHLLAHGLPLELAQRHLGHAARSTTAAYLVSERAPVRADWQAAWDATIAAQRGGAPDSGSEAAPLTAEELIR
jgi:integrase